MKTIEQIGFDSYEGLSICVPAFNEASTIEGSLKRLVEQFPGAEIIAVNDGSTDETQQCCLKVTDVKTVSHSRNIGYGGSLKSAMRYAKGSIIAWYDGDGQHDPEDLKKVIRPVVDGMQDAVIGTRKKGSDLVPSRVPGKMVLKWAAELVARQRIPDLNSGLRCFRAEVIRRYLHLLPDGFSASSTSTLLMILRGYRLGYVPITTQPRKGRSTVRMISDGLSSTLLIFRLLILFRAFPFFSLLAILQIGIGVAYGLVMALTMGNGFPVLAATVVISGVLTFFMGVICDQIVAIRKEKFEDSPVDALRGTHER